MPEKINQSEIMQESQTPEGEGTHTGLEIEKTTELDKAAESMSEIQNAIDHDQPVTVEAVSNLNEALANLTIEVGSAKIPIEKLKGIPDLEENAKIWREIEEGNFDNTRSMTFLPKEVAKILFAGYQASSLDLSGLTSAKGLEIPESFDGDLWLAGLTSAKGLKIPESFNGNLWLAGLTSAEGLKLPESVGGWLDLRGLTSAEGLKLPESVGGIILLDGLTSAEKDRLKKQYPHLEIKQ